METIMQSEIFSQSKVLNNTYITNLELVEKLASVIKQRNINQIIVAARGSSNNACVYFKYLCEIFVGIPVSFVHPSVVTMYHGKLNMGNSLVIGVSQSGKALDVQLVLKQAAAQGAICVAITNNLASPLALSTQYHFFLDVEEEVSVAATKTFTAQMLVLQMIVSALMDENCHLPVRMPSLPRLLDETFALAPQIERLADRFVPMKEVFVLSRGIGLGIGNEIALKLQETCYLNARSYAISDFHHGPFALVSSDSQILLIALKGETLSDAEQIVDKLLPTRCGITVFTQSAKLAARCTDSVILPDADEMLSPFAATVAGQLLALNLSIKRGLNPDTPRGLSKVTITK